MYLMPAARHASISSFRIGRDAFEKSVSPRQNFLKPPPVPDRPTVTRTFPRFEIWNSSAMASETGKTVLEPSILMTLCAMAKCGVATTASPLNIIDAPNLCHNFMDLILVLERRPAIDEWLYQPGGECDELR